MYQLDSNQSKLCIVFHRSRDNIAAYVTKNYPALLCPNFYTNRYQVQPSKTQTAASAGQ